MCNPGMIIREIRLENARILAKYVDSPSEETHIIIPRYNVTASCGSGLLNDHVEVTGGLAFLRSWIHAMGWNSSNLVVIAELTGTP